MTKQEWYCETCKYTYKSPIIVTHYVNHIPQKNGKPLTENGKIVKHKMVLKGAK